MPEFTDEELKDIANMVVGRHNSLAGILEANPNVRNKKQLLKIIEHLTPLCHKLAPYYTGEDS